jgi:hypothetical protein
MGLLGNYRRYLRRLASVDAIGYSDRINWQSVGESSMDEYQHLRESADDQAARLHPAEPRERCNELDCKRTANPGHAYCPDHEAQWLAQAFGG